MCHRSAIEYQRIQANTYKASSCQEQKYPLTEKGYCKNFFATSTELPQRDQRCQLGFQGTGLQKRVLHQTPIEDAALLAPGALAHT
jgi:hypothetical protein